MDVLSRAEVLAIADEQARRHLGMSADEVRAALDRGEVTCAAHPLVAHLAMLLR